MINNQIGFTASPKESRSTTYATDLAKMLEVPIFHVNGDDPEAVWYVARLCAEYRQKFNKDVFIDLLCYRRHGHNEGDEPSFTQPALYSKVKAHPGTRQIYGNRLLGEGVFSREELQAVSDALTERYTQAQGIARAEAPHPPISAFEGEWKGFRATSQKEGDPDLFKPVKTSVSVRELLKYSEKLNRIPENLRTAIRNHGGGHLNHSFFWHLLKKNNGAKPTRNVGDGIVSAFSSFDNFKKLFSETANARFGSGWAWLVSNEGHLEIASTANQDNPISEKKIPIMGIDVWEHAYYLKYQNRRAEYVDAFFNVINWEQVEKNFEHAKKR
ncbi:MAG: hypothetical protein A2070_00450 [Bdellovibrionales bacterium GWC1_52_8]|nr:MAG: hypothetical protein A2070_00450 [Bdellovibrionales bacterium GWC1_52_8]